MSTRLLPVMLALLLAGCGGEPPAPAASAASAAPATAEARVGDAVVNATVLQTSTLSPAIAQQFGIERSDRIALVLVNVRGATGGPAPAGVTIAATATPPDGRTQDIPLRDVQASDSLDRVGTVEIAPPESIRFAVTVRYGSATSTMQLTRDFYPR